MRWTEGSSEKRYLDGHRLSESETAEATNPRGHRMCEKKLSPVGNFTIRSEFYLVDSTESLCLQWTWCSTYLINGEQEAWKGRSLTLLRGQ
jgi:hypothetical protein